MQKKEYKIGEREGVGRGRAERLVETKGNNQIMLKNTKLCRVYMNAPGSRCYLFEDVNITEHFAVILSVILSVYASNLSNLLDPLT